MPSGEDDGEKERTWIRIIRFASPSLVPSRNKRKMHSFSLDLVFFLCFVDARDHSKANRRSFSVSSLRQKKVCLCSREYILCKLVASKETEDCCS